MTDLFNKSELGLKQKRKRFFFSLSCLGDLDWNCSGPISMEKKKKIQIHFSPHMETEPLSPRCYDSAGRCRYEPPLSDGDKVYKWQSESREKIAPDFDWKPILLCEQSAHGRESGAPCLIPAENCLSAFSYLSSQEKLYVRRFVPAVKPLRVCWTASLTPLNQLIQDRNYNFALFSLVL